MAVAAAMTQPAHDPCAILICPECGHRAREEMPADACLFFHVCAGCGVRLRPLPHDCCVFCSYGTVPCPPKLSGCCSA